VEDNLFIAIDAEDMLRALGAGNVVVAKSVSEAIAAVEKNEFTFALLDINLGTENSLPVARLLLTARVPFAFGTGYSKGMGRSDLFTGVPIVSKPYHQSRMTSALTQLLEAGGATKSVADEAQY